MLLCSTFTHASMLGFFANYVRAKEPTAPVSHGFPSLAIEPSLHFRDRSLFLAKSSNGSLGLPPGVYGFGCWPTVHSEEFTSDRNWFNTALQVLENIYDTRPNGSELAAHYEWFLNPGGTVPINISAVERGLEEELPIAFTNRAMVRFIRFFAQSARTPFAWVDFECFYWWEEPGEGRKKDMVAKGKFTPFTGYGGKVQ